MKNFLKNPFFLFASGFCVILLIFSVYPAVKITIAESVPSDKAIKCFKNSDYEDENCIQAFIDDCRANVENNNGKYSERPKNLVIPACDQTPDTTKNIVYDDKKGPQQFDEYCYPVRSCGLNDFVQLFVNLAKWGWWVLPALALLMFVWGGFLLLSSGGNQERIQQGKKMLVSVLVGGLIIILLAWVIVSLVVYMLKGEADNLIFGKPWFGSGGQVSANTGCCITKYLCYEGKTEEWCLDRPDDESWKRTKPCLQNVEGAPYTICKNKSANVCCVPEDPNSSSCELPSGSEGCSGYPGTKLVNKACALILQCLPSPGLPDELYCCVSDSGDCDEVGELTPCPDPVNQTKESKRCSLYGQCLGCCYNGTDYCEDYVMQSDCSNSWAQGQKCTPANCGQTCCSDTPCKKGEIVDLASCGAIFRSPEPSGECSYNQLNMGCCNFGGGNCREDVNSYYCIQSGGVDAIGETCADANIGCTNISTCS